MTKTQRKCKAIEFRNWVREYMDRKFNVKLEYEEACDE